MPTHSYIYDTNKNNTKIKKWNHVSLMSIESALSSFVSDPADERPSPPLPDDWEELCDDECVIPFKIDDECLQVASLMLEFLNTNQDMICTQPRKAPEKLLCTDWKSQWDLSYTISPLDDWISLNLKSVDLPGSVVAIKVNESYMILSNEKTSYRDPSILIDLDAPANLRKFILKKQLAVKAQKMFPYPRSCPSESWSFLQQQQQRLQQEQQFEQIVQQEHSPLRHSHA